MVLAGSAVRECCTSHSRVVDPNAGASSTKCIEFYQLANVSLNEI